MTLCIFFFFFNDTATTEIYTLSLHDALPISLDARSGKLVWHRQLIHHDLWDYDLAAQPVLGDRKSTRLNSSHSQISYAVFCLKKKKQRKYVRRLSIRYTEIHVISIC